MSFEQIRNELLHAQSSVVIDLASQKKYMIPSHVTVNQQKLYQAFGLKRSQVPYDLGSEAFAIFTKEDGVNGTLLLSFT
jgi:hypothetical protein